MLSKHIHGVCHHSNDVDGRIDFTSCCDHLIYQPRFENWAEILARTSFGLNDIVVQWLVYHAVTMSLISPDLRSWNPLLHHLWTEWHCGSMLGLQTQMEWSPLQTNTWCLTSFKWCGWKDRPPIMLWPSHLSAPIWGASWNPGSHQLWTEWHCGSMIEAQNPHGMVFTCSPNIDMVSDIIQMMRMGG
jgi:hypothetical protein